MAQENEKHKLKWGTAKKEEYKINEYDPNNENDWRNIPLFSNVLDPNNPQAAAIMALQKKEKPKNRAKTFKNSGNKAYLLGQDRYKDALSYYDQALNVKCNDTRLNSTIYANRAQIQLCLKNYGKVISDCNKSISLDPNTYKSYWRASIASRALKKYKQAIKYCNDGINIMKKLIENEKQNPTLIDDKINNSSSDQTESESESESESETHIKKKKKIIKTELEKLTEQCIKLKELKEKCTNEKLDIERKEELKKQKEIKLKMEKKNTKVFVMDKLKEKGIVIGNNDKYNIRETYGKKYKIKYDNKINKLIFPVLFMYPEYQQSDFIQGFEQDQHFIHHFNNMFPPNANGPSWDKNNKYLSNTLYVFYETEDRFINVNVNKSLIDIVQRQDYIIPIISVFFVLSNDSDFFEKFLKKKCDALLN